MNKKIYDRRSFLKKSLLFFSLMGLASFGTYSSSQTLEVTNTIINTKSFSKGLKILHFSDLHLSSYLSEELLDKLIGIIKDAKPDLIVYTGDTIVDGKKYIGLISDIFSSFNSKLGNYYVLGNHDYRDSSESADVVKAFKKSGFELLKNQSFRFEYDSRSIFLGGLDDLWNGHQELDATVKNIKKDDVSILLTHNPANSERISNYKVDVVLAGHTHGGQIYLPYIFDEVYDRCFNQKFIRGLYKLQSTNIYINRGIGSVKYRFNFKGEFINVPPIRLFSQPEISNITII